MNTFTKKIIFNVVVLIAGIANLLSPVFVPIAEAQVNQSQIEGLFRFGPIDPANGYPLWYQDKTGLMLGFCDNPKLCFLELPDPGLPVFFPMDPNNPNNNFPDEIFYFAAEAIMFGNDAHHRAILVQAIEGAFFNEAVVNGDQIVFARVRIRIDNLLPDTQYTVTTPYVHHTFTTGADAGPGTAKGPGLSITRDIGITEPLAFGGPIHGDIGPFLVPNGHPDNPTPPAGFIADGGISEMYVTGSPLNTNFFRIEGPQVADPYPLELWCSDAALGSDPLATNDCVETHRFVVLGKKADRFGAKIDRATYSRTIDPATGQVLTYINVWASTASTERGEHLLADVMGGGVTPTEMTRGFNADGSPNGNYFVRLKYDGGGIPEDVRIANISDNPAFITTAAVVDELAIVESDYIVGEVGGGMKISVQSSDYVGTPVITATMVTGQEAARSFTLTQNGDGLYSGIYNFGSVHEEWPPIQITVNSTNGGSAKAHSMTQGAETTGLVFDGVIANAGADRGVVSEAGTVPATVTLNGDNSLGPVTSYLWTAAPAGVVTLLDPTSASPHFLTPTEIPGGKLTIAFTLMVSDGGARTHSDVMTVTIIRPQAMPTDICELVEARYRVNREKWIVEGQCDPAENQRIDVYLGNDVAPDLNFHIGTGYVQNAIPVHGVVMNLWTVARGNGSAISDNTIPAFDPEQADPKTPTDPNQKKLWFISNRNPVPYGPFSYTIN